MINRRLYIIPIFIMLAALCAPAHADGSAPKIDSGDTAWMLTSAALVLFMTPALGLFYCGMVRSKNVLSVLMQSFVVCGIVSLQWVMFGYSLAFGPDHHGLIGDLSWWGLHNVSAYRADSYYAPTVPHQVFCMFQLMFAIITPALISGAVVERMKFKAYCLFIFLWSTFVYDPIAHWVWGNGGWLNNMHVMDFAGGSVVEMSSGFSALVLALMVGKRRSSGLHDELRPHSLPLTALGAGILWFGWFGFNGGSAGNAGHISVSAFVATHIAGASAAFTWMILDWMVYKKPSLLGFCSGIVAGLVAITQACGFVSPLAALAIGIFGGAGGFLAIRIKNKLNADDSLDVFGVHGCCGLIGCICTGLLACAAINGATNTGSGHDGWFNGGTFQSSMVPQLWDAGATIVMAMAGTFIIALVVKLICRGLRSPEDAEENGLDLADHGETGYSADSSTAPVFGG